MPPYPGPYRPHSGPTACAGLNVFASSVQVENVDLPPSLVAQVALDDINFVSNDELAPQ